LSRCTWSGQGSRGRKSWNKNATYRELRTRAAGRVETWTELVDVREPVVAFRQTFRFHSDGAVITSDSTLRFRGSDEIAGDLDRCGFNIREIRGAPDRPGLELVFLAQSR
jgi:hypothetical protein